MIAEKAFASGGEQAQVLNEFLAFEKNENSKLQARIDALEAAQSKKAAKLKHKKVAKKAQ